MTIEEKFKKTLQQENRKRVSINIDKIKRVEELAKRLGYKNKGYNIAPLDTIGMERYINIKNGLSEGKQNTIKK